MEKIPQTAEKRRTKPPGKAQPGKAIRISMQRCGKEAP
jgi:hypothetical protein